MHADRLEAIIRYVCTYFIVGTYCVEDGLFVKCMFWRQDWNCLIHRLDYVITLPTSFLPLSQPYHRNSIKSILLYSNTIPIKSHWKNYTS